MALNITNYSETLVNPCYFVDITVEITGGTGVYDILVDGDLILEGQTSPVTINTYRGIPKNIAALDSEGVPVGVDTTKNTQQLNSINVDYTFDSTFEITVTIDTNYTVNSLYLYSLDGVNYQISNTFEVLTQDNYTVYVKDSLGCVKTKDIEIGSNLKYFFEFTDVKGIKHRCEIYDNSFLGIPTEINGYLTTKKSTTEDTLEVIRGGGLTINLEASTNLTFEDFYTENERTFYVKYIRDSVEEFLGWLSPEGLYQSFVADKWIISLYCTDGLGFLKNLSYVENDTGLFFTGKQSVLEVIVNCLKRTNLPQDIYTYTDVYYNGQAAATNTLAETYINANRFIKDDDFTIMNCDEVLRSVFDIFGCCITQYRGSWVVFKPNSLKNDSSLAYYAYNSEGVALSPAQKELDFSFTLGSDINGFYPHHVNANQQLTIDSAIGAYRINYKYGLVKRFFENTSLDYTGPPPNYTVDEWTINSYDNLSFSPSYLVLDALEVGNEPELIMTSDSFLFLAGNSLNFKLTTKTFFEDFNTSYNMKVVLTDGVDTFYLKNDGTWSVTSSFISQLVPILYSAETTLISSNTPIGGNIHIEVYTPVTDDNFLSIDVEWLSFDISPVEDKKGENHTFQVITKPSSKIEDTKEVYNGDLQSDAFIGTIYKADSTTPTETWNRGNIREIPLLRYAGEERMAMYNKPLRVFSGDVFGYVDYLRVIQIDGFNDIKFMPIEYKYDALKNITTLKLKEIYNDAGGVDYNEIDYSLTYDYGNVVEPTIKG